MKSDAPARPVFAAAGRLLLFAALCGWAGAARAVPPDARVELKAKTPRIEKIDADFSAVEVDDPKVVRAELLPSGELLLDPVGEGEAHVFLFAQRLVRVIEVAVGRPLTPPSPEPAGACAKPVVTPGCYPAWRARLQHLPAADAPKLAYELEGMQAEARAAGEALAAAGLPQLQFARSAFGVKIRGAKDAAARRAALRAVWGAVLGPLRAEE